MTEPIELMEAKMIDNLCQRYHCLPSEILAEDVSVLRMIETVLEGTPDG